MKLVLSLSLAAVAALVAASPGRACEPLLFLEPIEGVGFAVPFEQLEAPLRGGWWVPVGGDRDRPVELIDEQTGAVHTIERDELTALGPSSMAIAVPDDAVVGQLFRLAGRSPPVLLAVASEVAADRLAAPSIRDIQTSDTSVLRPEGCGIGFTAIREHFFTEVQLDLDLAPGLDTDDALLDVWVLARDQALPPEQAPRAFDKVPLGLLETTGEADAAITINRAGSSDVHVRVTDPRTGLSSPVRTVTVFNLREPEGRGWDYSYWSWGCAAANTSDAGPVLGLLLLLWVRRRARGARFSV
jgi:hypothetical protein